MRCRIIIFSFRILVLKIQALLCKVSFLVGTGTALESALLGSNSLNLHTLQILIPKARQHLIRSLIHIHTLSNQGRHFGNIVILPLTLLLLQLEGNTADGTLLNAAHQVGGEAGNLVAKALRGDDGDLTGDALVGLEVEGEAGIVLLNEHAGCPLDSLGANAALK